MTAARIRVVPALFAAIFLGLLLGAPAPVAAQGSGTWVLDRFVVSFPFNDPPRPEEIRDRGLRSFRWGGERLGQAGDRREAIGDLSLSLPDRIIMGSEYRVALQATAGVTVQGRMDHPEGSLTLLKIHGICWDDNREGRAEDELRLTESQRTGTLRAAVSEMNLRAPPGGPDKPNHNCEFDAEVSVGMFPSWRMHIQAQYKPAGLEPSLELDATARRLPPSGAKASSSDVTATALDAAGRAQPGIRVDFGLEPADMGLLDRTSGLTDARGTVRVRYTAPNAAGLRGRDRVTLRARDARGLERGLELGIERFRLRMSADPVELPVLTDPASSRLRVVAEDFDGRPAADAIIEFALDPPDMGTLLGENLLGNRAVTDAQGVVELLYEAPRASALRGREQVTLHATNISQGGEAAVSIRLLALRVLRSFPESEQRDVQLDTDDELEIRFDRPLDPNSVQASTVSLETLWHGDLRPQVEARGATIWVKVTQSPIPDVGLKVKLRVKGGEDGPRGQDGSLMAADHELRFSTMPSLRPRLIVSQVVDDPREPQYQSIALSTKPFILRVEAGLDEDSELTSERVAVRLVGPGEEQGIEQTFYPGRWPPLVPDAAGQRGNSANFVMDAPLAAGSHSFEAWVRPADAPENATVSTGPVSVTVQRWRAGNLDHLRALVVPIVNDRIPGFEWAVSRQQMERWAVRTGNGAGDFLPSESVSLRMGYFEETTCVRDECNFVKSPIGDFRFWIRHVGRAGFLSGSSYILAAVPPGWLQNLSGHPDVLANPGRYHNMDVNGLWTEWVGRPGEAPAPGWDVPLIDMGLSSAGLVHAIGDVRGRPHSAAEHDLLAGYDLAGDRAIESDGQRWRGAYVSIMNESFGLGLPWMAKADYEYFLDRWTERPCLGPPPCRPGPEEAARPVHVESEQVEPGKVEPEKMDGLPEDPPVPALGFSGGILRTGLGQGERASIDPLLFFDGVPALAADGTGDYAVELRDATGGVLARYPFVPRFAPFPGGEAASFLFSLPRPNGMAAALLVRGDREIGGRRRSPNPPRVSFLRPAPSARLRGVVDMAWAGQDPDREALRYHLLASADGGASWMPLLVDSVETSLRLESDRLPNGPAVLFKLQASDGFDSDEALLTLGLDNPQLLLGTVPEDGEIGVSPHVGPLAVLRDPLDPATLDGAFRLTDRTTGVAVAGDLRYDAWAGSLSFQPTAPLTEGRSYEARVTTAARRPDGVALPEDLVWRFRVRGPMAYLPWATKLGLPAALNLSGSPSPRPPTRTAGPGSRTPTPPGGTSAPSTATPSPTPIILPSPTSAPTPAAPVAALRATTTGADGQHIRTAFIRGETIKFWLEVDNQSGAPASVDVEFVAVADSGPAPAELSWRGRVEVPVGIQWLTLERVMPANAPTGQYIFVGNIVYAGTSTAGSSAFQVASALQAADEFGDPSSGWGILDDGDSRSGYLEGAFQILIRIGNRGRWSSAGHRASDFIVEADLRLVGDAGGAAGLAGGLTDDGSGYLVFLTSKDGRYGLFRRGAGSWQTILPMTATPLLATDGSINHLMLARNGSEIRLYANARLLAVAEDPGGGEGRQALYAEGWTDGFDARFDNWRLYRP
jgi:hypothetical protein